MKIDSNDPRLTAYALGELAESERAEFEKLLSADADARQEVERIRRAATALSEQLAAEPCPRLEADQRLAIHERLDSGSDWKSVFSWKALWMPIGFAAAVAVVFSVLFLQKPADKTTTAKLEPQVGQTPAQNLKVPAGMRAVTIGSNEARFVGTPVAAGDHVDVIAQYHDTRTKQEVTKVILADAPVLSSKSGEALVLAVKPDEAALLQAADRSGSLSVAVRPPSQPASETMGLYAGRIVEPTPPPGGTEIKIARGATVESYEVATAKSSMAGHINDGLDARADGGQKAGGNVVYNDGHAVFAGTLSVNGGITASGAGNGLIVTNGGGLYTASIANFNTAPGDKEEGNNGRQWGKTGTHKGTGQLTIWSGGSSEMAVDSLQKNDIVVSSGGTVMPMPAPLTPPSPAKKAKNETPQQEIRAIGDLSGKSHGTPVASSAAGINKSEATDEELELTTRFIEIVQNDLDELGFNWSVGGTAFSNTLHPDAQRNSLRKSEQSASTSGESYTPFIDNPFLRVTQQPLSTFGLDVDTASYANIRRFLTQNQLPPRDSVRIAEMLNYFTYDYPAPKGNDPFALYVEMGECPWNPAHRLALIGMKAKEMAPREQPPLNLVFLIDISGSMSDQNKLPLIKQAFHLLVPQLDARDRVSLVVYANNSRVVLNSTRGDNHEAILAAIDALNADGGTNGGEGIQSAYREATSNFIKGGINRVILCTDGDFNVGITDPTQLSRLIEDRAKSGVFLNVFGFGMGNTKDSTMSKLASTGRGQYAYIDDIDEARKNLVDQVRSSLLTVVKDTKVQIEFNPALVQSYRLIGYESRVMQARDFNNDRKTEGAGSLGSAHTVTALYEIIPANGEVAVGDVDPLKYQPESALLPDMPVRRQAGLSDEWMTIKLRYKEPAEDTSKLITAAVKDTHLRWRTASDDFRFAAAVATFGLVLRDSPYRGEASCDLALELAAEARRKDPKGYRAEFVEMVNRAKQLGLR